jgi:plasmid stabilization system protein ParE
MSHRLIVRPKAESDIRRAYRWYETELEGLGMRFLRELNEGFEKISANPRHYADIAGGIRRKLLSKFPYGVFFVFEDQEVRVIAVLQHAQSPDVWKSRK